MHTWKFMQVKPCQHDYTFGQKSIIHLYDNANKQMYDRVDCFPDKFEQSPTCMEVLKLLAACSFPTSVQTFMFTDKCMTV